MAVGLFNFALAIKREEEIKQASYPIPYTAIRSMRACMQHLQYLYI